MQDPRPRRRRGSARLTSVASVLALVAAVPAAAQDRAGRDTPTRPDPVDVMRAEVHAADGPHPLPYRWYAPPGADEAAADPDAAPAAARYPLVVFLHGAGERGDDNRRQLVHGVADLVAEPLQRETPCFVLAPQCPGGVYWHRAGQLETLIDLIEELRARPAVDADRVYLTGLSMGGFGTWALLARRPDLFTAAVPICGAGDPSRVDPFLDVPVWAFHGGDDRVVPAAGSRDMVRALRARAAEAGTSSLVRYTEYAGVGHDSWTRTYGSDAVLAWLLAQRRLPAPRLGLEDGARVVFLGDSITQAGARPGGYVRLAEAALRAARPDLDFEFVGAGISGNKVPDLAARLERDVLAKEPTLVVVYIGINDVWHWNRGRGTKRGAFAEGLASIVERIRGAGADVLLCTPSVIGERTDGGNRFDAMLDRYAMETRALAAREGLPLLDLRLAFQTWLDAHNEDGTERGLLTRDAVHLNEKGNRFVADLVLEALGVARPPLTAPERKDGGPW